MEEVRAAVNPHITALMFGSGIADVWDSKRPYERGRPQQGGMLESSLSPPILDATPRFSLGKYRCPGPNA